MEIVSGNSNAISIREASLDTDKDCIWNILRPIVSKGEEYCFPQDWTQKDAINYWFSSGHSVFVAVTADSDIVGTYFIHPNQKGNGNHICNCGYAVLPTSMNKGVGSRMCDHSLELAKKLGYYAMQYNFVVSSNTRAVALWERKGFEIVGRIPNAFKSPVHGLVDAFVFYKVL